MKLRFVTREGDSFAWRDTATEKQSFIFEGLESADLRKKLADASLPNLWIPKIVKRAEAFVQKGRASSNRYGRTRTLAVGSASKAESWA